MRRSAVCFSAAFGMGICIEFIMKICVPVLIVSATVTLIFAVCSYLYNFCDFFKTAALIICFILLGAFWLAASEMKADPLIEQAGRPVRVQGMVTGVELKNDSCSLIIKRDSVKTMVKYHGDYSDFRNCKGRTIEVCGIVELPQEQRNPRCFDYSLYLRTCGIRTIIIAESVKSVHGPEIAYLQWTGSIRNSFRERIGEYTDEFTQGMIIAILFGDKAMLDEDTYSDFQKNGTAHVLAVSGLHTGIIYAFFVFLWKWKKGSLFYISVSVLLLIYMSLADFSPSVVRASCMIFLHLIAEITRSRYDLLTAAGITFALMLVQNPYQLFNTGFQMSFLAVASLAVIIPFVKRYYQGIFLSAIAIQAGMVPYTAFVFNYIPIGSVLANIPVIFLAGIILPTGLCALVCMFIPGELFGFLIKIMELSCSILVKINDFFYASGKTSFDVVSPPVWLLIIYYGILFFLLSETGQLMAVRKQTKKIMSVTAVICIAALLSIPVMSEPFDDAGIVFVDVGQGDCIHIKTDSGKNYLIDGGGDTDYDVGRKVLKPYLLKNGVSRIDAAFVTHLHEDHYGGIKSLTEEGMIAMTGVYDANRCLESDLGAELGVDVMYLYRGCSIDLDEGISVEVVAPEVYPDETYKKMLADEENENQLSLILKVKYKGKTLLVTGDIDEDGEADLIKKYESELSCDIMKVPHHGSKYSSSENFVDAAHPALAVFQVGKNNYGHPSEEAIGRYRDIGCETARNDRDGAIGLIIDGSNTFQVIKMLN